LDDTTSFRLRTGGQSLDLPSRGLRPERSLQFESGIRMRSESVNFSISGFYTMLEDFIRRVPGPSVDGNASPDSPKENASEGRVYGVEASASIALSDACTLTAGGSWVEGWAENPEGAPPDVRTPRRWLDKVNPLTGILTLRVAPPKSIFWAEGSILMVAEQDRPGPSDMTDNRIPPGGTPGFALLTIRGGVDINSHLSVTAAIENVLNQTYRFHGSGQNEPGLNVLFGLEARY
jgi:hemoglobin/transferrin/lactoferrin receptor protein